MGERAERAILPLEVTHSGKETWLSAKLVHENGLNRFHLDRIVAVRTLRE